MCGTQRVVSRQRRGIGVAVRIGRAESGRCRRRGGGRQVGDDLRRRGRIRGAFVGCEREIGEAAGVETASGQGRVDLQVQALGRDDVAILVELELTVACVAQCATVAQSEEAVAADREVEVVAGRFDVALCELLGHLTDRHAVTDRGRADAALRRGEQIAELRARALETRGRDVGEVVRRDVQVLVGGIESGEGNIE